MKKILNLLFGDDACKVERLVRSIPFIICHTMFLVLFLRVTVDYSLSDFFGGIFSFAFAAGVFCLGFGAKWTRVRNKKSALAYSAIIFVLSVSLILYPFLCHAVDPVFRLECEEMTTVTATATIANGAMFSLAAGGSFAYMDNLDLSSYSVASGQKRRITLTDAEGDTAVGYIGAADTGYLEGAELLGNVTFEDTSWWTAGRCTIASVAGGQAGNCLELTATSAPLSSYVYKENVATLNALYSMSVYIKDGTDASRTARIYIGSTLTAIQGTTGVAWAQISGKKVCRDPYIYIDALPSVNGNTTLIDTPSLKQITNVATTGVRVVTTPGGSTEGWTVGASFNYNAATYTVSVDKGCYDSVSGTALSASVASTRYGVNASGLLVPYVANTVALETVSGKTGVLTDGFGVNLCTYSADLTQAVWAKVTMTAAKNQTGPDGVANSASLITATGSDSTILFTSTSPNQAHSYGVWMKRVTGTGAVSITANNGSNWTAKTITTSWAWYAHETRTTANPVIGIKVATSGDQVAVFGNQVETGSYSTSPIPTNGAIGIRASSEGGIDTTDVWTGTATIANGAMFSFAAGASFAYLDNHLLTQYVKASGNKYRIRVNDDDNGYAVGFIGAADSAYAVGEELLTNGDFATGDLIGWTPQANGGTIAYDTGTVKISEPVASSVMVNIYQQLEIAAGGLLYVQTEITAESSGYMVFGLKSSAAVGGVPSPSSSQKTVIGAYSNHFVSPAANYWLQLGEGGIAGSWSNWDNNSVKQVLSASANGVRVVTATDGSTEGWTITAGSDGLDYNNATYTVTVEFVEVNGYYMANSSLSWPTDWGTGMDPALTFVAETYPKTAAANFPALDVGIFSVADAAANLLYLDNTTHRFSSHDGTNENIHHQDFIANAWNSVAVTADATGHAKQVFLNGVLGTGTTTYDDAIPVGTNLVLAFDNSAPFIIYGLTGYSEAAAAHVVQTSGVDGEINYTEVAPATLAVRGIHVRAGDTGTKIQNDTIAGDNILSCLICLEESAEITNSAPWTSGPAAALAVAATKTATGSNNYLSGSGIIGAGAESFTAETWDGADPFVDYANGDFTPTKDGPLVDAGIVIAGLTLDVDGNTVAGNGKPDAPTISAPADEATNVSKYPAITGSAFSQTGVLPDIGAIELQASTHTGSEWEICLSGNGWVANVVDSGDDASNLESYTVGTRLSGNTAYDLRVRYETDAGWSAWSSTIDFTTGSSGRGSGRGGMGMQMH